MTMSLKAILSAINITKVNNMKPHKHAALIAEAVQDMTKQIYLKTPKGWIESQLEYVVEDHAGEDQFSFAPPVKPQFTPEQLQSVLEALETARKCIRIVWVSHHANRCDKAEDKLNAAIAALEKYRGQR